MSHASEPQSMPTEPFSIRVPSRSVARLYRWALMAITAGVFFAPYLSWRLGDVLFTFSDALFCIGLVLLIAAGRLSMQPFGALSGPWLLAFLLMQFALFASSMINGDPTRWLIVALQYSFAMVVLPMLVLGQGAAATLRMAKALVAGVVAMELLGIVVYYTYTGSYTQLSAIVPNFISGGRRLGVFLEDGNWNGSVVAMTLPFVFYLRGRGTIGTVTAAAATLILATALVLAASATALIGGTVAMLLYVLVGRLLPSWRVLAIAAAVAVGLMVSGIGLPQAFSKRIAPAIANQDIAEAGTFAGRMALNRAAWDIVEHTIFLGLGVDQFRVVSTERAPVHNTYLLLWSEGGLLALIGWLLMLTILFGMALAALRHDRRAAALALAVLSLFLVASTASPHMYARMWLVPVMVAIACAAAARPESP